MVTIPQPQPAGKATPLLPTSHSCPHCATGLKRWALSVFQPPVRLFWCGTCCRPVCLEPREGAALAPQPA